MSRRITVLAIGILLAGCAKREPPLYHWGDFSAQQYHYLLHEGGTVDGQIRDLEALVEQAAGEHAALPPGLRTHLGMLYVEAGNPGRARELWLAEKDAFPESAYFIDRQLLVRLDAAAAPQGKKP